MVFDIPVPEAEIRIFDAFEFIEYVFVRFSENIGQDIKASTVSHPNGHSLHTQFTSTTKDGIQRGDGIFSSFEGEALLTHKFLVQKMLKNHRLVEFAQDSLFLFQIEPVILRALFKVILAPIPNFLLTNMLEFDPNTPAIDSLQAVKGISQGNTPCHGITRVHISLR